MSNVVRTGEAGAIQTSAQTGVPLPMLPYTTLNQKYGVGAELDVADGEKFAFNTIAIGNKGHDMVVGNGGFKKWKDIPHIPQHKALYNGLPWIVRPETDDLSPVDRAKYRMRCIREINGVRYVFYYLRVVDKSTAVISREIRRTVDGVTTTTAYVPSLADLSPQPPILTSGESLTTVGDYMTASCRIPFIMTEDDIYEFSQACKIIHGDTGYDIISEIALVNNVDRSVQVTHLGAPLTYTEAVRATATAFVSTAIVASQFKTGVSMMLDVGAAEPLLTVEVEGG